MPARPAPLVRLSAIAVLAAIPLAGCVVAPPSGPSVVAMPRQGESLNTFQADDYACRDYAQNSVGSPASQQAAETNNAVGGAAIGTALGAAAGALLGAASGHAGAGAAVGAGAGLLGGAAVGSSNAAAVGELAQGRYDVAYSQCMVSKGYAIQGEGGPAVAGAVVAPPPVAYAAPPPVAYAAPPPVAYAAAPPVAYVAPAPYPYAVGVVPIFIAGPGWYHGHYYARRGYYDRHGHFMPDYHGPHH